MNAGHRSVSFVAMILVILTIADSCFANNHRSRGRCKKKCCAAVIDVPGMGTFNVDFAGCGVSLFPDENVTDTNLMFESGMVWAVARSKQNRSSRGVNKVQHSQLRGR